MKQLYINIFENIKGIRAFFSTKDGASNGSPYYNEEALQELGFMDRQLVQPQQVHEAKIGVIGASECRIIDETGTEIASWSRDGEMPEIEGWEKHEGCTEIRLPRTDGVITDQPDMLLTTVHADCLPVWFYDEAHRAIGVVHAGWRGTLAGIAPKAVKLMKREYGSDPASILVHIGPGISKCCFETGPEVIEAFRGEWDFADDYAEPKGEKYYIDLKGINVEELLAAGVKRGNITVSSHCTCCEPETFASYRREGGTYLRMGAGICLTD